jgi:hypothetical protein
VVSAWNSGWYSEQWVFRGNATLCVSSVAIVHDGRRRDKMFNAEYLANNVTILQKKFS